MADDMDGAVSLDPEVLALLQRTVDLLERYVASAQGTPQTEKLLTAMIPAISGLLGALIGGSFAMIVARMAARTQTQIARSNAEREWRQGLLQGVLDYAHETLNLESRLLSAAVDRDVEAYVALYREMRSRNILRESRWLAVDDPKVWEACDELKTSERRFTAAVDEHMGMLSGETVDWNAYWAAIKPGFDVEHERLGVAVRDLTRVAAAYIRAGDSS